MYLLSFAIQTDRAIWERSGKADYVNQSGEWFILMRVTSIHNKAHMNNIHVKNKKENPQEFVFPYLQGNIKRAQWNKQEMTGKCAPAQLFNHRRLHKVDKLDDSLCILSTGGSNICTVYVWFYKMKSTSGIRVFFSINVLTRLDWMLD